MSQCQPYSQPSTKVARRASEKVGMFFLISQSFALGSSIRFSNGVPCVQFVLMKWVHVTCFVTHRSKFPNPFEARYFRSQISQRLRFLLRFFSNGRLLQWLSRGGRVRVKSCIAGAALITRCKTRSTEDRIRDEMDSWSVARNFFLLLILYHIGISISISMSIYTDIHIYIIYIHTHTCILGHHLTALDPGRRRDWGDRGDRMQGWYP